MRVVSLALAASVLAVTQACYDDSQHLYRRGDNSTVASSKPWGYGSNDGPLSWHVLDKSKNGDCALGKQQTPINLDSKIKKEAGKEYKMKIPKKENNKVKFENKGHTVEVNGFKKSTLKFGNTEYELQQAHLHTPGEHQIEGEYSPMEIHFVHKTKEGKLAVVGFLIEIGRATSPALRTILRAADKIKTNGKTTDINGVDFHSITDHLSKNEVYRYQGSLTTPPCTEGIEWIVSKKPLIIDWMMYNSLKHIMKFNARFIQSRPGEENTILASAGTAQSIAQDRKDGKKTN
ncbi:alpha carbonic anhydrase [Bisporella sp. PMI_857]|nr:alpha carbonic anhydrase [Bisporella sp. PMI_857]